MSDPRVTAADVLHDHQQQLDMDGVMVGVSRQAVDEVLAELATLRAENELMREALEYYGDEHQWPNEGPWGANSTDFGARARNALAQVAK